MPPKSSNRQGQLETSFSKVLEATAGVVVSGRAGVIRRLGGNRARRLGRATTGTISRPIAMPPVVAMSGMTTVAPGAATSVHEQHRGDQQDPEPVRRRV